MFDYELKDKQVILILADEVLQRLRPLGVTGSPLLATVHKVESFCQAHVFIPAGAIFSAVSFPEGAGALGEQPGLHIIGFAPAAG